jgi:hypothetical protein
MEDGGDELSPIRSSKASQLGRTGGFYLDARSHRDEQTGKVTVKRFVIGSMHPHMLYQGRK